MPKRHIEVVGAVLTRGQTVLTAQRSKNMTMPGHWEFPGGKIEPGETPEEALTRELQEELACVIEVGQPIETTVYEYDFGIVSLTTFHCTLLSGEPVPIEHSQIRWVCAAELHTLNWAPADLPTTQRVMEDLA